MHSGCRSTVETKCCALGGMDAVLVDGSGRFCLDVLEQDPSVIDPFKVGVTGCSRLGKGAFVAGVLDNRIALTIQVESGMGGSVGLRLVEVIDSYSGSEWPYHGISYVRWLSEVALGPFT